MQGNNNRDFFTLSKVRVGFGQREITLRDSLQKFITLHKARSVYLWGWCRMLVEIELLPRGWPHGVPSMPKNLKKVQIYPNPVITLLEVNSLTLHNLHYNVLVLCKAARPAKIKEKIKRTCGKKGHKGKSRIFLTSFELEIRNSQDKLIFSRRFQWCGQI